jgi:hypothetical protein
MAQVTTSVDTDTHDEEMHRMMGCEIVLVLLTRNLLVRPECLLGIFEAVRAGKLIITVNVLGGGYDYARVRCMLVFAPFQ